MTDPLAPLTSAIRPIASIPAPAAPGEAARFADALRDAVAEVNRTQKAAEASAREFALGRSSDVAATMLAVERATVTFQLMLQVRNRLLEAYQELQRIQV